LRFTVVNNAVEVRVNGVVTPLGGATAQFAFSGHTLKLCVGNIEALLPAGTSINGMSATLTSNATFDFLAEDQSLPMQLDIPAHVALSKIPAHTAVCPGGTISFTLTVLNPGPAPLDSMYVDDVLGAGLTYVSDDAVPPSTGDATTRHWVFTNV